MREKELVAGFAIIIGVVLLFTKCTGEYPKEIEIVSEPQKKVLNIKNNESNSIVKEKIKVVKSKEELNQITQLETKIAQLKNDLLENSKKFKKMKVATSAAALLATQQAIAKVKNEDNQRLIEIDTKLKKLTAQKTEIEKQKKDLEITKEQIEVTNEKLKVKITQLEEEALEATEKSKKMKVALSAAALLTTQQAEANIQD